MDRAEIANLVDALDHPDAEHQRGTMDQLAAMGPSAVDALAANLDVAPMRARSCLVRVLEEIGSADAVLPLMRYVFDTKESIEDADARGLAMKAIVNIADESQAEKLFDFALDMVKDRDRFVRGYALTALGRVGDRRALPIVRESLSDGDDFVRERAQVASKTLQESGRDVVGPDLDDDELLTKVRTAKGGQREMHLMDLRTRDNAFELAERLVGAGGKGVIAGLETLLTIDDRHARVVAMRHFEATDDDAERTICLRIFSRHAHGDAEEAEAEKIKRALDSGDEFVQLAALEAAAVSGDPDLVAKAVQATRDPNVERRYAAARGLSRGLGPSNRRVLPDLMDAYGLANARRMAVINQDNVHIEAFIVRAMHRVVADGGFGTAQAQEIALGALENSTDMRPLLVTALDLLDSTTPKDGLPPERRWPADSARNLLTVLSHPDDDVRNRVLDLMLRGAPAGLTSSLRALKRIVYDNSADIAGKVIPLIERVGNDAAAELLKELTAEKDDAVRHAAEAALRRMRNEQDYIDAEFAEEE